MAEGNWPGYADLHQFANQPGNQEGLQHTTGSNRRSGLSDAEELASQAQITKMPNPNVPGQLNPQVPGPMNPHASGLMNPAVQGSGPPYQPYHGRQPANSNPPAQSQPKVRSRTQYNSGTNRPAYSGHTVMHPHVFPQEMGFGMHHRNYGGRMMMQAAPPQMMPNPPMPTGQMHNPINLSGHSMMQNSLMQGAQMHDTAKQNQHVHVPVVQMHQYNTHQSMMGQSMGDHYMASSSKDVSYMRGHAEAQFAHQQMMGHTWNQDARMYHQQNHPPMNYSNYQYQDPGNWGGGQYQEHSMQFPGMDQFMFDRQAGGSVQNQQSTECREPGSYAYAMPVNPDEAAMRQQKAMMEQQNSSLGHMNEQSVQQNKPTAHSHTPLSLPQSNYDSPVIPMNQFQGAHGSVPSQITRTSPNSGNMQFLMQQQQQQQKEQSTHQQMPNQQVQQQHHPHMGVPGGVYNPYQSVAPQPQAMQQAPQQQLMQQQQNIFQPVRNIYAEVEDHSSDSNRQMADNSDDHPALKACLQSGPSQTVHSLLSLQPEPLDDPMAFMMMPMQNENKELVTVEELEQSLNKDELFRGDQPQIIGRIDLLKSIFALNTSGPTRIIDFYLSGVVDEYYDEFFVQTNNEPSYAKVKNLCEGLEITEDQLDLLKKCIAFYSKKQQHGYQPDPEEERNLKCRLLAEKAYNLQEHKWKNSKFSSGRVEQNDAEASDSGKAETSGTKNSAPEPPVQDMSILPILENLGSPMPQQPQQPSEAPQHVPVQARDPSPGLPLHKTKVFAASKPTPPRRLSTPEPVLQPKSIYKDLDESSQEESDHDRDPDFTDRRQSGRGRGGQRGRRGKAAATRGAYGRGRGGKPPGRRGRPPKNRNVPMPLPVAQPLTSLVSTGVVTSPLNTSYSADQNSSVVGSANELKGRCAPNQDDLSSSSSIPDFDTNIVYNLKDDGKKARKQRKPVKIAPMKTPTSTGLSGIELSDDDDDEPAPKESTDDERIRREQETFGQRRERKETDGYATDDTIPMYADTDPRRREVEKALSASASAKKNAGSSSSQNTSESVKKSMNEPLSTDTDVPKRKRGRPRGKGRKVFTSMEFLPTDDSDSDDEPRVKPTTSQMDMLSPVKTPGRDPCTDDSDFLDSPNLTFDLSLVEKDNDEAENSIVVEEKKEKKHKKKHKKKKHSEVEGSDRDSEGKREKRKKKKKKSKKDRDDISESEDAHREKKKKKNKKKNKKAKRSSDEMGTSENSSLTPQKQQSSPESSEQKRTKKISTSSTTDSSDDKKSKKDKRRSSTSVALDGRARSKSGARKSDTSQMPCTVHPHL